MDTSDSSGIAPVATPTGRRSAIVGIAGWIVVAGLNGPTMAAVDDGAPSAGPTVPLVEAVSGPVGASVEWDAVLQAVRATVISAQTTGRVTRRLVQAGDTIRAGQRLAEIDDRESNLAIARAEAQVASAQANLSNATAAVERARNLRRQGFVSQASVDTAAAQYDAAAAARREADSGLRQAKVAGGFTDLVAPYDGVVTAVRFEVGDLASPGRPMIEVHAPGQLRAVAFVPTTRAGTLGGAPKARVMLDDPGGQAKVLAASAVTVIQTADAQSGTTEVRVDFSPPTAKNDAAAWTPGRHVRVAFDVAAIDALTVPDNAVLRRGELQAVYVWNGERFVLRAVRLGRRLGDRVEILAGLKPGERIAADPVRAGLVGARAA